MTALKTTISNSFGESEARQQLHEHFCNLREYWEGVAGLVGGLALTGVATNAYRADSDQTEEPDFSNGALDA
jgi:hypothetical protein